MSGGGYQVVRKLASGGMAELWLAHPSGQPHQLVALKRILPQFARDPDFVGMFLDEAKIASDLDHPNVVRVHEVGWDGGETFLVMEFLDGDNLRGVTRQLRALGRPLSIEHAVAIVAGAARGLHYAHEKTGPDGRPLHIVHRDVSPQNILVTRAGAVKVVDFGIAKAAHRATETQVGTLKGKVPYMSPEQCHGEALDRRSDIWSLGVVLYELTVGRRLITKAPDYLMMRQIIEEDPTPPSSMLPMYPEPLEEIVLKALSRRRGQRHQTMEHLAQELELFARSKGWDLGPGPLAEVMREAFGAGFVGHDEDTRPSAEAAKLPELRASSVGVRWSPSAEPPKRPRSTGTAALRVDRAPRGNVERISLHGRFTETFQGAELGASLAGDVVIDASDVQRVTSFGVREWLAMNEATRGAQVYLARCAEPIVNQLTMVRGFLGNAKLISFQAPYACTSCGATWSRLIDADADADAITAGHAPDADCPQCRAPARFDDDVRAFAAMTALLSPGAPDAVRAALDGATPQPPIEKRVDASETILVVRGPLSAALRWRTALQGVEGDVAIDLGGVPSPSAEGVDGLRRALAAARADLGRLRLVGAPDEVVAALVADGWPLGAAPLEPVTLANETLAHATPVTAVLPGPPPQGSNWRWLVAALVAGAALVAIGAGGLAAVGYALWTPAAPPPPLVIGAATVEADGAGRGANPDQALAAAQRDASRRLIGSALLAAGRGALLDDAALARFDARHGAWVGSTTLAGAASAEPDGSFTASARLSLPRDRFDALVARWTVVDVAGLRVALATPADEADGAWIIASTDPEVPAGAEVAAIDGAAVPSQGPLPPLRGKQLTLRGATGERTVRLP
jgi:anti-anti-sigma regulatory factor